ncbi:hypothetical protein [Chryseolinea sp. H1M3-3]|uniref:hypothetical protein n=1 Tax=Chryseolinea sp. H1M3-3 TaxID=3034144 RepID=UPI0023EC4F4E|nr:hypothetical protein [Chryseolinea sp. H1M3-3]
MDEVNVELTLSYLKANPNLSTKDPILFAAFTTHFGMIRLKYALSGRMMASSDDGQ